MLALRTLYDENAGHALLIAKKILQDEGDAEDVIQETFIALWNHPSRFDSERGSARTLIVTMARNRAIDRRRGRGSARRAVDAAHAYLEPAALPGADQLLSQNQESHRVHQALGALPIAQRKMIDLAYFQALTQREISRKTGEPLGTVKMRIHLAMKKLSNTLARKT